MSKVVAFLKDKSGATAIEYGLIAAGISVVIIATVNAIGSSLNSKFQCISDQLKSFQRLADLIEAAGNGGFFLFGGPFTKVLAWACASTELAGISFTASAPRMKIASKVAP